MSNIRTRLTYQFAGLVTLLFILFALGVYFFSKLYLEKRFYQRLQDRAITTTTLLFDLGQTDSTVQRIVSAAGSESLLNETISVYNEPTKGFLFSTNPAGTAFHAQFVSQLQTASPTLYLRRAEYRVVAIRLTGRMGSNWVLVSGINQAGSDALADLRKILIVMVLAAVGVLTGVGWLFAGRALSPMTSIIGQVNAIFPANLGRRVEHPNDADEIGRLVATFNRLLDRIEQAMFVQKMFIANVSHELKNPLTKINSQIDVALIQPRTSAVYEQTLQSLHEDTRILIQLTNTLLELANVSILADKMTFEPVRLDELLWEVKTRLLAWHPEYQVHLAFPDFPDDENALLVRGNRSALGVLLTNLLDNACKFSPEHAGFVTFKASTERVALTVFNRGVPIPATDLPHVFEPFFRSNATAFASNGHGVGLAVVKQITELHEGSVSVQSDTAGTTFSLVLRSLGKS